MLNKLQQFLREEKGAETLEYIAIAAVIIILGAIAYQTIGINTVVNTGMNHITNAIGNAG